MCAPSLSTMAPYTPDIMWAGQRQPPPPLVTGDLTGKTIIITGANVGLGFEACKHFTTMNPNKIVLACRNLHKGATALKELAYPGAEVWPLDLSSFKSVVQFADRAETELDRLDIIILNASMVNWGRYELTADGFETTCVFRYCSFNLAHHSAQRPE